MESRAPAVLLQKCSHSAEQTMDETFLKSLKSSKRCLSYMHASKQPKALAGYASVILRARTSEDGITCRTSAVCNSTFFRPAHPPGGSTLACAGVCLWARELACVKSCVPLPCSCRIVADPRAVVESVVQCAMCQIQARTPSGRTNLKGGDTKADDRRVVRLLHTCNMVLFASAS